MDITPPVDIAVRPPPSLPPKAGASPKRLLGIVAMAAAGACVGFVVARSSAWVLLPVEGVMGKFAVLVLLPVMWLVVVGFHELGHVVGGWLGGGRFLLWVVGPIKLQRTPSGVKLGWNRSVNLGGGMAACVPLEAEKITLRGMAVMVLGGPGFSLLLALLGAWAMALSFDAAAGGGVAGAVAFNALAMMVALTTLIFLVTAAPFTAGGFKSDGRRVWDLARGGERAEQEGALMMLTTLSLSGVRPADYDEKLMATALKLDDGSIFDLYARLTAYYHAADRGDWRGAQRLLDTLVAREAALVPLVRDVVRCEYAWLLATRSAGVAEARAWLESAGRLDFDPATRLKAEAAVLLAEGRRTEAAEKARAGLEAVEKRTLAPTKNVFAEESLRALLDRSLNGGPER